ncbi:hypothetical protein BDD12DRAFT_907507 [Trichophaea hybrida]|nr:hypothetical protein BDD12DRAFT_907507 [Trichophaea hybrida]
MADTIPGTANKSKKKNKARKAKALKAKQDAAAAQEAIDSKTMVEAQDHFWSCVNCDHIERFYTMDDWNVHKVANEGHRRFRNIFIYEEDGYTGAAKRRAVAAARNNALTEELNETEERAGQYDNRNQLGGGVSDEAPEDTTNKEEGNAPDASDKCGAADAEAEGDMEETRESTDEEVKDETPWIAVPGRADLLDALKVRSMITMAMDCIVAKVGLCSLETELEGALQECRMNMAMWEELRAMKRDINRRAHPYGESQDMREVAKRYSNIKQKTWGTLDAAMNLIGI